jgi:hypothetical protein
MRLWGTGGASSALVYLGFSPGTTAEEKGNGKGMGTPSAMWEGGPERGDDTNSPRTAQVSWSAESRATRFAGRKGEAPAGISGNPPTDREERGRERGRRAVTGAKNGRPPIDEAGRERKEQERRQGRPATTSGSTSSGGAAASPRPQRGEDDGGERWGDGAKRSGRRCAIGALR